MELSRLGDRNSTVIIAIDPKKDIMPLVIDAASTPLMLDSVTMAIIVGIVAL